MAPTFDAQWYLDEYPDVAASGMAPHEHYMWLGRRLNRLPAPPGRPSDDAILPVVQTEVAPSASAEEAFDSLACDESAVNSAFRRLCEWLDPGDGQHRSSISADDIFDRMRWDFGSVVDGDQVMANPNARKLVELMDGPVPWNRDAESFALPRVDQETTSILLATYYAPSLAHAGGLRLLDTYAQIRARVPDVRLTLFAPRQEAIDGDISRLHEIFDTVLWCPLEDFGFDALLRQLPVGARFDLADLQFHQAGELAPKLRGLARRLIFTPMETLSRFAFDEVRDHARRGAVATRQIFRLIHEGARERAIMRAVDLTVCVSDADAGFLAQLAGPGQANYFPTGLSGIEFARELGADYEPLRQTSKHNRLVFAAYFGSETNRIGLEWYLTQVHPRVLAAVPDYDLAVVGRGDTAGLQKLGASAVRFIGEVPNLSPVLEQAKAGLVLALNGSGFRGKINQYALCGVPSISTSLGATGLTYVNGLDIVVADGAEAFARACIEILTDDAQATRLAESARQRALGTYTWDGIWPRVAAIYGLERGGNCD